MIPQELRPTSPKPTFLPITPTSSGKDLGRPRPPTPSISLNRNLRARSQRNALCNLLELTRTLLASHEVKICMDFLDALANSKLGQVEICFRELTKCAQVFADTQRNINGHSFAAISLLEDLVEVSALDIPADPAPLLPSDKQFCQKFADVRRLSLSPPVRNQARLDSREIASQSSGAASVSGRMTPTRMFLQSRTNSFNAEVLDETSIHPFEARPSSTYSSASNEEVPPDPHNYRAQLAREGTDPSNLNGHSSPRQQASRTISQTDATVALSHDFDGLTREQESWLAIKSDSFILHPTSPCKMFWDTVALVLIIAECITLPLAVGFAVQIDDAYQTLIAVFFSCDLVVSFTTGYFHGQVLVMRRSFVTLKYFKTWFMIDVICLIPWDTIIDYNSANAASVTTSARANILRMLKFGKLFRVVRLTRVAKTGSILKRLQVQGFLSASLYEHKFVSSCAKMFLTFGFLSHWGACIWSFISSSYEDDSIAKDCSQRGSCFVASPWVVRYGLDTYDAFTNYLISFHYLTALICGAEAPVSPGTHAERIFTILVLMWAIFITALVLGDILLNMEHLREKSMAYDEQLAHARQFMVARQIPLRLQERVYRYLEAQQKSIMSGDLGWKREFMTALSEPLQIDLVVQLNRRQIRQHPFFKLLDSSSSSVRQICLLAKPYVYAGGDIIVMKADVATSIIFLVRGKVHLREKEGRGYILVAPCWHSERCLFYDDELRTHTLVAVNSVEVLVLERKSLLEVLNGDQLAKQHYDGYCETLRKDTASNLRCVLCGNGGHTTDTCQHLGDGQGDTFSFRDRFRQMRREMSVIPMSSMMSTSSL